MRQVGKVLRGSILPVQWSLLSESYGLQLSFFLSVRVRGPGIQCLVMARPNCKPLKKSLHLCFSGLKQIQKKTGFWSFSWQNTTGVKHQYGKNRAYTSEVNYRQIKLSTREIVHLHGQGFTSRKAYFLQSGDKSNNNMEFLKLFCFKNIGV